VDEAKQSTIGYLANQGKQAENLKEAKKNQKTMYLELLKNQRLPFNAPS